MRLAREKSETLWHFGCPSINVEPLDSLLDLRTSVAKYRWIVDIGLLHVMTETEQRRSDLLLNCQVFI